MILTVVLKEKNGQVVRTNKQVVRIDNLCMFFRVWFLPEETYFFRTSGRNWKKPIAMEETYISMKKPSLYKLDDTILKKTMAETILLWKKVFKKLNK